LRFRLATLLLAITGIAIFLAWKFHREPINAANVGQLSKLSEIPCPSIFKLVYSPDRRRVAFVGWERPVEIREAVTLWPVRTVGADRKLIDFAFSPDPQRVAYSENSTIAEILTHGSQKPIVLDTENAQPDVVFSPDGKLLATGGYATEVKLWDAQTGKLLRSIPCRSSPSGLRPVFSPDGATIAVGDRNAETQIFDVATGELRDYLPERETQEIAYHPSGHLLAVAYANGSLRLWGGESGTLLAEHVAILPEIYTLDWSPDGKLLASAGLNGDICIWDTDLKLLHKLPAPEWVISVKFSPDGTRLMTAGGSQADRGDSRVTIWGVPPLSGSWSRN
jgi:WD40 repeat protein